MPSKRRNRRKKSKGRTQRYPEEEKKATSSSHQSTGGRLGSSIGGMLGSFAEKGLSKLFGMGEYQEAIAHENGVAVEDVATSKETPEVNSLVEPVNSRDAVPLMHMDKEGHVRLTRREFVQNLDIDLTANQQTYQIKINPGIAGNFPWLSGIATSFQQFAFIGFAAEYVPTSGLAISGTNASLGTVNMAFKYDVSNPSGWPATSVSGLLNFNGSVSSSPAAPSVCYMECDPEFSNQPVRFVQTESMGSTLSPQNTVAADLIIINSGAQSDYTCGQLWFTYDIMLMNPRTIDPSPPIAAFPQLDKLFEKFVRLYQERRELMGCNGPYSATEIVLRDGEIARIGAILASPEFLRCLEKYNYLKCQWEQPTAPGTSIPKGVRDVLEMARMSLLGPLDTSSTTR